MTRRARDRLPLARFSRPEIPPVRKPPEPPPISPVKLSKHFPWLTLLGGVVALALGLSSAAAAALQLDRVAFGGGAWWQLLTGHFTHWTGDHLAWDVLAFLALGGFVELHSRRAFAAVALGSALVISVGVLWLAPALATYRGLSGIDSALFTTAAAILLRRARAARSVVGTVLPLAALLGFAGKIAFELTTGRALFVASSAAFVPVPLAHLLGALVGLAAISLSSARSTSGGLRPDVQSTPGVGAQISFPRSV